MDLHAFRRQVVRLKELGPSCDLLAGMPGLDRWLDQRGVDRRGPDRERETRRILGMIDSMTALERSYPFLMTVPGRRARIARGAGVEPSEVARFFDEFKAMSEFATGLGRGGWRRPEP